MEQIVIPGIVMDSGERWSERQSFVRNNFLMNLFFKNKIFSENIESRWDLFLKCYGWKFHLNGCLILEGSNHSRTYFLCKREDWVQCSLCLRDDKIRKLWSTSYFAIYLKAIFCYQTYFNTVNGLIYRYIHLNKNIYMFRRNKIFSFDKLIYL